MSENRGVDILGSEGEKENNIRGEAEAREEACATRGSQKSLRCGGGGEYV